MACIFYFIYMKNFMSPAVLLLLYFTCVALLYFYINIHQLKPQHR